MKYIYGTILTLAAMLLTACSYDSDLSGTEAEKQRPAQLLIDGSILSGEQTTRTVSTLQNTSLEVGNTVGVFIYRDGQTAANTVSGEAYGYTNYPMQVVSTSTTLYNANPLVFPYNSRDVDIYAYAPHNSATAWSTLGSQTFEVAADQTSDANYIASDLLWAYKNVTFDATAFSATNISQTASLTFQHMLSQICVNVTAGDGISAANLDGVDILLTGIGRTGTINLQTGAVAINNAGNAQTQQVTVFKYGYEQDGTTASTTSTGGTAIIYPHTAAEIANAKVQLTVSGTTFQASLATTNITKFDAGKKYTYNVRVTSEGLSFSVAITPWDSQPDRPVTPVIQ